MMEGVNVLANAVKVTLGPKGGIDHNFAQDRAQRWAIGLKEVGRFLELSYPWRCKLTEGWKTCPKRSPHITLQVCGFISEPAILDDDFDGAMLARQRAALAAARLPAFTLAIGGIDSFDSAAFLRVRDPARGLTAIRAALAAGHPEACPGRYTPHVTIGLYRDRFAKRAVRRRLTALATLPPLRLAVRDIVLAGYAARELDGPLETLERVALGQP
jgi:2'-5' RNA ligase